MTVAKPPVVSAAEWAEAQQALAQQEAAAAEQIQAVIAARKRMPMVRVERDYAFEGPTGRAPCSISSKAADN